MVRLAADSRADIESALSQGKSWTLFHGDITRSRSLRALVLPRTKMLDSFREKLAADVRAHLAADFSLTVQEIETEGKVQVHHALFICLRPVSRSTSDWG